MSVNTGDNTNQPQNSAMRDAFTRAQPAGNAAPAAAPSPTQFRGRTGRPAILDINQILARPVGRKSTGELVRQLKEAFEKELDGTFKLPEERECFRLFVMDRGTHQIALSTILMTFTASKAGREHMAVYQMVVEGSNEGKLLPRQYNVGATPVSIELTPGDTVDPELWSRISTFLTETTGRPIQLHDAGALTIPSEFSPNDQHHVHRVVYNASQALYTVMENSVLDEQPAFSIEMTQGAKLTAEMDYNPADVDDATALPVRSDLAIALRAAAQGGNTQSVHENVVGLGIVHAYIEPIYVAPPAPVFGQPPTTQRFVPRLVMTRIDSEFDAITLESHLMGIITATLANRNLAWGAVYRHRASIGGEPNLRDIGAIGYEVNLTPDPNAVPERIDTRPEIFGVTELAQLLRATFYTDRMVYSLDVAECGELSWIDQTFLAAAQGEAGAYQAILEAANRLTNGHFARIWQGTAVAAYDDNRIHRGYFENSQGQRRDLREIDYIALQNMFGGKDPQVVMDWVQTHEDVSIPLDVRLDRRWRILNAVVDAKLKGYIRRITFTADFMTALEMAAEQAGLVIAPANISQDFQGSAGRAQYNTQAFAVSNQVGSGLYSYQASPYGNFRGGVSVPYLGRFGRNY